jgi:hypothetical protein
MLTLEAPLMVVWQGVIEALAIDIREFDDEPTKRYIDTITSFSGVLHSWHMKDRECKDPSRCNVGFVLDCWHNDSLIPQILDF